MTSRSFFVVTADAIVESFGIVESQDHYETARVEIGRSINVVDERRMLHTMHLDLQVITRYVRAGGPRGLLATRNQTAIPIRATAVYGLPACSSRSQAC